MIVWVNGLYKQEIVSLFQVPNKTCSKLCKPVGAVVAVLVELIHQPCSIVITAVRGGPAVWASPASFAP